MRSLLCVALLTAVIVLPAGHSATLLTSVSCTGYNAGQTTGTSSDSCSTIYPDLSAASAKATSGAWQVTAWTQAHGQPAQYGWNSFSQEDPFATATASLDEDLTFTVYGSSGAGIAQASLVTIIYADPYDSSDAEAQASLGAFVNSAGEDCCGPIVDNYPIPFTFGVPFTLHLHLSASAAGSEDDLWCHCGGGNSTAFFQGLIDITSASGQALSGTSYTVVDPPDPDPPAVPEPAAMGLTGLGLLLLIAYSQRRRHASRNV